MEERYSKRQKAEGGGQKVYYQYIVVSAVKSVLTFMATAIKGLALPNPCERMTLLTSNCVTPEILKLFTVSLSRVKSCFTQHQSFLLPDESSALV